MLTNSEIRVLDNNCTEVLPCCLNFENYLYNKLNAVSKSRGQAVCLRTPSGISWTDRELRERVSRAAGVLESAGILRGDRVLVHAGKCPDLVASYWACLQTATVYVAVNISYTAYELDYFIEDAQPVALITQSEVPTIRSRIPLGGTLDAVGSGSLARYISHAATREDISEIGEADIASILYTSGTTGRAKGAMLT